MFLYLIQIFLVMALDMILFLVFDAGAKTEIGIIDITLRKVNLALLVVVGAVAVQWFLLKMTKNRRLARQTPLWVYKFPPRFRSKWLLVAMLGLPLVLCIAYLFFYAGKPGKQWQPMWQILSPGTAMIYTLFFLFRSFYEELVFRGILFRKMVASITSTASSASSPAPTSAPSLAKRKTARVFAIVFTQAVIFALLHSLNPEFHIVRIFNIFIAAFALGFAALSYFPLAVLFHFLWNYLQAFVLGLDVSGYRFHQAMFRPATPLPSWEDNPLVLLALIAFALFAIREYANRKAPLSRGK